MAKLKNELGACKMHGRWRRSYEPSIKKGQRQFTCAEEALKLAVKNKFDLGVIGLPDQNGLKLMEQLRDQFGLKGIGLSGYGMAEHIARGRKAGFVRHLTKPVRFDRLTEVIAELGV